MSTGPSTHAAVLLAAGGSRRLGRPKQLLTRDGEPLVRRAARLLAATSPRRLLVVLGAQHEAVRAALDGIDCEAVANPAWARGLASSLAYAGDALRDASGSVLIAACDQPAMDAARLQALLAQARRSSTGCAATRHADGNPGIPAVVPTAWLVAAELQGDRGLGARLRALPPQSLAILDAPDLAFDIDMPADVEHSVARGWLDPPPAWWPPAG